MHMVPEIFQIALGSVVVGATVAPLLRSRRWYLRFFDFPRAQIMALGLLVLLSGFVVIPGAKSLVGAVFVAVTGCVVLQGLKLLPYVRGLARPLPTAGKDTKAASISLFVANVYMPNRNSDPLKDLLRQASPDIAIVVETDSWWIEQLSEFEETYGHVTKVPLDNTYGMVVFTRLDVVRCDVKYLTDPKVPSVFLTVRIADDVLVDVYAVHPRPPDIGLDTTHRDDELGLVAQHVQKMPNPAIVAGDLNDVAWSRSTRRFQQDSGLLDPRIGRGLYNTFNAKIPFVRWPLDHIFVDRRFHLIEMRRLPSIKSDHFPIMGSFRYVGAALPHDD